MTAADRQAELDMDIRESVAIAQKALAGMDPEVARCVATAMCLHLFREMSASFGTTNQHVLQRAAVLHAASKEDRAFRLAAMWTAMEELAGASMESFPGAGDHVAKAFAKNEAALRDFGWLP